MDIEARLEYIIFENKANHYVVAGFSELKTYHNFTAAGRIEDPIEDQEYVLQGEYVKHPKYGEQFRVDLAKKKLPDNYKNLVNEFPSYTWSFLHEVGHIECNHIQGNNIFRIFANFIGSLGFAKIANSIYFKLKEERQATEWAINYAIHNTNIVRKFTNELQKVYCRYYKSMNLEE